MTKLLTVNEVAELLRISRSRAYELSNTHDFPSVRVGRLVRVPQDDLINWLHRQQVTYKSRA